MPNEVWNRLVIEGPERDVQRFVERVVSKEIDNYTGKPYILDFEAHVPLPPDTTDVTNWVISAWGCRQPMRYEGGDLVSDDEIAATDLEWVTWDEEE